MLLDSRSMQNAEKVTAALAAATTQFSNSPLRQGSAIMLPRRGQLLVTGDLHDNPIHLEKILKLAKLDAADDYHVVFQEIIHSERLVNGIDLSHRMLLKIVSLILQFPHQVHLVLANHELSQMMGQGVSKGAGNNVDLFNAGLEFVFHDDWEKVAAAMAEFVRALPLAVRSEHGILVAHSLPSPRTLPMFDVEVLHRSLTDDDYETAIGSAYLMVWGRGHTNELIDQLVDAWGVKLFLLGHDHVETGCEMRGPKLIKINSDHEHGSVVRIDLSEDEPPPPEEVMMSGIRLAALG